MANSVTQSSEFFEAIIKEEAQAFQKLASLVGDTPLKEAEWIEYKSGFDKDVEEHWSKALSGFANAGGGLIIWGIQTRNEDNHDVPDCLVLVNNPTALAGRLETLKATVVEPPVLGVKIQTVLGSDGKGFVVALIPESDLKPHQAKHGKHSGRYFIRIGFQTLPAPHSLIRTLFYPHSSPVVEPIIEVVSGNPTHGFTARLHIKNVGAYTAHEPIVQVFSNNPLIFHAHDPHFSASAHGPNSANLNGKHSIHPDTNLSIGDTLLSGDTVLRLFFFARDMKASRWTIKGTSKAAVFKVEPVA